ncbi:hypothetical protein HEK616_74800 (plasmid) [Streptomyces nigrescens]|uniref:Uncharacterized protein n=2 Tax=Streptomyces TaxID=1883 RepID=A0ABN6R6I0_STRNI|nr:hypothetical protein [Streptomyces nigrescens]MEE4419275.1 hypothetical protein [Streptomyces sp. DSM 41528]BDM73993.1 hypothetical protein HEK616_74800 [Streptomyces nigrescens]
MFVPTDKVGLFPVRMEIEDVNGSPQIRFDFQRFIDTGVSGLGSTFAGAFNFFSSDVTGISTSNSSQQLDAGVLESSNFPIPPRELDANLRTVSAADPTSALETQNVKLVLGGFSMGQWSVQFETPIHAFNLDGRWAKV